MVSIKIMNGRRMFSKWSVKSLASVKCEEIGNHFATSFLIKPIGVCEKDFDSIRTNNEGVWGKFECES